MQLFPVPHDALTSSTFFDKEKDAFQFMEIKKKPRNSSKTSKNIPHDHEEQPTQPSLQLYDKKEEEGGGRREEGGKRRREDGKWDNGKRENGKREDERREDGKREDGRREDVRKEDEKRVDRKKEDGRWRDKGAKGGKRGTREEGEKEGGKEEDKQEKGGVFGEVVESVIKKFGEKDKNLNNFELKVLDSVVVPKMINQRENGDNYDTTKANYNKYSYSMKFTLPETFFSQKIPLPPCSDHSSISLLSSDLNMNVSAFKNVYSKENVVKMLKVSEEAKLKLKLLNTASVNRQTDKLIRKNSVSQKEKAEKGKKGAKLSKIIKINNDIYILVHDLEEKLSRLILLDKYKDPPSKSHCFDQELGYFYIYDNKGTISAYIGSIKEKWNNELEDKRRKLFDLKLLEEVIDPVLYVLKFRKNESVLLVIGGHMENNKKIMPYNKISVFVISYSAFKGSPLPLFKIKMRYGRMNPLICKQTFGKEKFLLILGGNNPKKVKREQFAEIEEDYDSFTHSLQMVESIKLKTIKEAIFQAQVGSVKDIGIENTLKIGSDHKEFNKMYSFCQGGVIKMKIGKVGTEGKTNLFVGVGKSRRSIYLIDYFDYKNFSVYVSKAYTKIVARGILYNAMICYYNNEIVYLVDGTNKNYKKLNLSLDCDVLNKSNRCEIF